MTQRSYQNNSSTICEPSAPDFADRPTHGKRRSVCIFIESLQLGGAEKQGLLLAKTLKPAHDVIVVVLRGEEPETSYLQFIEREKLKITILQGHPVRKLFHLVSLLRAHHVQVMFCYLASANVYGAIAGRISGVRHVMGGIRNSSIPTVKLLVQRFLHNHLLSGTIFNNHAGAQRLAKEGFEKDKIYVIPNGIEVNGGLTKRPRLDTVNLVTIARFVPQKDYWTAIRAFHYLVTHVLDDSVDVRYRIIGYGELESALRNWISDLGLNDKVSLIIGPDDRMAYLKQSDIYLCTSLFEGISNSIMEAMSYGLPIVATNVGDNPLLVEHGETGYLCTVSDYEGIALKLKELIVKPKVRSEMGIRSYRRLKARFSLQAFRKSYNTLLENLRV